MKQVLMRAAIAAVAVYGLSMPAAAQTVDEADGPATDERPEVLTFPRELVAEGGKIVLHVPQVDNWQNFAEVTGRFAIEATPDGEQQAVMGVAEFTANTEANVEERVVAVDNMQITVTSFPEEDDQRRAQLDTLVRGVVQQRTQYVPLDMMLSYIAPTATLAEEEGLSFEPPPIFHSTTPAILLMTDGEPVLAPVADTRLKYAVNTNWDLFQYREREWYLRHGTRWLKAKEPGGAWKYDRSLPRDFKKLPDDDNWAEARSAIPPAKGDNTAPTVYYSEIPAELIVTNGQPSFSTITAGGLEYVHDTESDLFRYDNRFYYLVSGRWFSAAALRGPWEHAATLPEEFKSIRPDGPKGHVLAAVAGSDEARLAVLEASIPRKATVSRDAGQDIKVFYQGEPEFESVPGTAVHRVVNSPNDVLMVDGVYFLCLDAVWYRAETAEGPWVVADTIPAAIYAIPPSSPSYHVTHVHVYESDDDSVSTGYTSGYFGVHVGFGIAMYGSGWYYPPFYGYGAYYGYPYYPYYYPYPYSYGASAWYNPNTGMYGRSASAYGPYGGYGRAASYNPETGTYARGGAVWDSNEIAGMGYAYNPRTGTGVATNRYVSESGGWGESLITQNDKWVQTRSEWSDDYRRTEFDTSGGRSGEITRREVGESVVRTGRTSDGDLYAGKDGQVYRRDDNGWYQRGEDGWNRVEVPEERAAQIDQARTQAAERRDSLGQVDSASISERRQSVGDAWSGRTYDSSRSLGSFDANRRSELNRNFNARTNGYDRFDRRVQNNSRINQSRQRGGRVERRFR